MLYEIMEKVEIASYSYMNCAGDFRFIPRYVCFNILFSL